MSTEATPQPQEQQQTVSTQPKSYNPFIAPVNEKPYAQMSVEVGQQQLSSPIPEPSFQSNRVSPHENPYGMLNDDFGASMGQAQRGGDTFNPSMNSLPDADKKLGAEHMAKLIVDGYEQLHTFANKGLQVPERKIRKLVAEGEIDLSVQIPYDYGKTITAGEFFQEFNEQNKDTLTVSKEFKKEVTPVLTRVLQKRGAGVTDEQYLIYLFGKDILVKGVIFSQIRGTMNDMINVMKEYTTTIKENGGVQPQAAEKPRATPPPPPPPPSPSASYEQLPDEPIVPFDSDDFNFKSNETVMDSTVQKHQVPQSGKARLMAQKKRDREIEQAMQRVNNISVEKPKTSYADAINAKKSGKRGRKPKDYIVPLDEEQIAEAIVLRESKPVEKDKIEGLD
jgi:hypothetical protein